VIASLEEPEVIARMLAHRDRDRASGSECWRAGTGTCAHCGAGATEAGQAAVTPARRASVWDLGAGLRRRGGSGVGPVALDQRRAGKEGGDSGALPAVSARVVGESGRVGRRASIPVEPLRSGRARLVAGSRVFESTIRATKGSDCPITLEP
jgi:hypothetical protein